MKRQGTQRFDKRHYQQRDAAQTAQQTPPPLLVWILPKNDGAVRRNATGFGYFSWRFRYFHESFVEFFFPAIFVIWRRLCPLLRLPAIGTFGLHAL
jgi:hypothetical protein